MVWRIWQETDRWWTSVEQVRDITSNARRYVSTVSSSRVVSFMVLRHSVFSQYFIKLFESILAHAVYVSVRPVDIY